MPIRSTDTPYAKRSFGQNFLQDKNVLRKIADAADLSESDTVIEIGAGRGALTELLVERAGRVIAIELDRDLYPLLEGKFKGSSNFILIHRDALTVDFSEFKVDDAEKLKLTANLPYYISTAILQHLIEQRKQFSTLVLMFQKEVVDRITASPSDHDRGFLTVLTEAFMTTEKLFDVSPQAFRPVPKVWSSVVRLTPRYDAVAGNDPEFFRMMVSTAFRQKRKTILNNLKGLGIELSDLERMLFESSIDPKRRAETLSLAEWETLFKVLKASVGDRA